jgi:hypothetical protein
MTRCTSDARAMHLHASTLLAKGLAQSVHRQATGRLHPAPACGAVALSCDSYAIGIVKLSNTMRYERGPEAGRIRAESGTPIKVIPKASNVSGVTSCNATGVTGAITTTTTTTAGAEARDGHMDVGPRFFPMVRRPSGHTSAKIHVSPEVI